ncbi:hypothetical protein J7337_005230 [Fusarium musae]|uniref:Uncharacterized protein n=1 Tax=Fusarium musae TaxID=1042133 RepID=A0A9P8IRC5_9HYPO|nr:hypothetical protein J7337_005230 [Fusarium musae]KAG9502403.1 hypothetical protein J7337_005230 [Fusarium musae]
MAEQALDQIRDLVDGQIDFEGQKLAELLATVLLVISGVRLLPLQVIPDNSQDCLADDYN